MEVARVYYVIIEGR